MLHGNLTLDKCIARSGLVGFHAHKAKLNKAKFHFFEKGEKRAKSYQYFRLTSVRLSQALENLEKCSMLIVKKNLKQILSFFGTDLCEDIATMLSLVSFTIG